MWDRVIRGLIYFSSVVAMSLIILIFIFVAREALPVVTSAKVHEEVTLETLFLPQNYGSPEAPLPFVWQPVSAGKPPISPPQPSRCRRS